MRTIKPNGWCGTCGEAVAFARHQETEALKMWRPSRKGGWYIVEIGPHRLRWALHVDSAVRRCRYTPHHCKKARP